MRRLPHNYEPGDHLFRRTNQQLVTMKFSMLAIAATAFAGVQGFAPVANPSARVMAMQVRRFPIGCFGWLIECSLQMEKWQRWIGRLPGYYDICFFMHVWSCHVMLVGFPILGREHMRSNDAIGYRQLNLAKREEEQPKDSIQ